MRSPSMSVLAVLGLSGLSTAAALTPFPVQGPACVLPHDGNPPFQYLWGGDLREVFVWQDPSDSSHERAWVAEDGGRIRYFDSLAGTWVFQDVPTSTVLLDIFFLSSGTGAGETGWAVGKGGVVLRTDDHGNTWTQIATEYEPGGDPGTLWGIFFRNQTEGWLAADHFLRHSTDGGVTWTATTNIIGTGGCPLVPADLEYYSLDFIEVGGSLRGICGAEPGVILTTSDGNTWAPARCDLGDEFEVWDVSFEPNPASVATARVYACGGPGATLGEIYTSSNGGTTWTQDAGVTNILYGIEALPSGGGVACGYGGAIFKRISGTWTDVSNYGGPLHFTAPLGGVDSDGSGNVWVVGSFGHLRKSTSGGDAGTWADDIPYMQLRMNRLRAVHFVDDDTGWIAGQIQFIAKTDDGGCSFTVQHGGIGSGAPAYNFTGLAFSSSSVGVAVGVGGSILYTTDGGTNWNAPTTPPPFGNYSEVAWNGGSLFYVVGSGGIVARSANNGQTWTPVSPPSGSPNLSAITFLSATSGFVVGDLGGTGKAYRLQNATTTPSWVDVSPTFALTSRPLSGVALRGVLPSVEVYAVGSQGVVLKWKRSADKFETVPGVYEVDGSGNPTVQLTHEDNLCVALPIGATTIFVGTLNQDEFPSDEGKVLYFDGTSWSAIKCQTTKGIQDFSFPQPGLGYGAGHANTAQATGNFGDSSIVLFRP